MIKAAIAIGSNSTRLLVVKQEDSDYQVIARGREETRLFLGLDEQGCILPDRLESTAQAVFRLWAQAKGCGALLNQTACALGTIEEMQISIPTLRCQMHLTDAAQTLRQKHAVFFI